MDKHRDMVKIFIFRLEQTEQGALGSLVLNSGATFKDFMLRLKRVNEFELEIIDLYSIGVGA